MIPKLPFSISSLTRGSAVLGLATASVLALSVPLDAQTLRAVKHSALRVLDPIQTTAYMSRNHGYMIYDTLFALDESLTPQPQMVDTWSVSDDGMVWSFTLREGLIFHDGEPVTGADVAASIARWGSRDGFGQLLMAHVESMEQHADDPSTMVMTLSEPFGLVIDALAKPSSNVPFIMPARVAATPGTDAIEEHIGSGPFRWVADEFQPGVIAVYERFDGYIPREEPASWAAGGKVVHVDRVEWIVMPDAQTTLSALMSEEIDYWEDPPADLLPILDANPDVTVRNINLMGMQTIMRPNMLHPPFDDPRIRRAAIASVYQGDVLQAMIGNPDLYELCAAMFVCGTPLGTNAGGESLITGGDPELARQLLEEAGYDGTPVVVMHPTDVSTLRVQPVVVAQAMRDAGFTVDLQAMDWQTLVGRRANQAPPAEGGWNMFITNWVGADVFNPIVNNMVGGQGTQGGWFGWADDPELEAMRMDFARATSVEEQAEIAERIQLRVFEMGYYAPIGQYFVPTAWSNNIEGILDGPAPFFWNVRRVD